MRLGFGVVLAWAAYKALYLAEWHLSLFLIPLALFVVTTVYQTRALRRLEAAERAVAFYRRGLARLDEDFSEPVSDGAEFLDPHHRFASDLDLFGPGSLFVRICHARTRLGARTLARWLLDMAGPPAAEARNAAAEELAPDLDIREKLAVLGPELRAALHPEALRAWASAEADLPPRLVYYLYASNVISAVCMAFGIVTNLWGPFALAALIAALIAYLHRRTIAETLHATSDAATDLRILSGALRILEQSQFEAPLLKNVQDRIQLDGPPASARIAQLAHLAEWIDSLDNVAFKMLDVFFLFSVHFCRATGRWRSANGKLVPAWLEALGEFEALASLAAWRYENPHTCVPEWLEGPARIEGRELRHPLLPRRSVIANSLQLGPTLQLLLVSGSNMSGKSTFLRTVGVNVILAHAGAHVSAESLSLTRLSLGASIRTVDSLQEGASRFYAELQRIKQVADAAAAEPTLLFLLDELLSGTNSHDRRIGASAIVRSLLAQGALGLVTTHDLALAAIADADPERASNVHFEDQITEGRIQFDYRMKPGVVRTSNALALMRAVGLEIPDNPTP